MNSNSRINHGEAVYIPSGNDGLCPYCINFEENAYHQNKVLYIIKPQERCTLKREEIQSRRAAFDDIPTYVE